MQISINGENVFLSKLMYESNNRVALSVKKRGELYAILTVNLPDEPMDNDEVAIDVNNLGKGIIKQLVDQSIIKPPRPERWVQSGFISYPICQLLI